MSIMSKAMNVILYSEDLSKDDLQKLLQAIRDCEQQNFPSKVLGVFVFTPEMSSDECREILQSIVPPYAKGPLVMGFGNEERGKETDGIQHNGSDPK